MLRWAHKDWLVFWLSLFFLSLCWLLVRDKKDITLKKIFQYINNEYSKIFLSSFFLYSKLITTKSKCIDVCLLLQNDMLICIFFFFFSFCKRRCKIFFFCNIHLPACLSDTQFSDNICIKPYKIFRKIRKVEIILKINQ